MADSLTSTRSERVHPFALLDSNFDFGFLADIEGPNDVRLPTPRNRMCKILHIPIDFSQVFPLPNIRAIPNSEGSISDPTATATWGFAGQLLDDGFQKGHHASSLVCLGQLESGSLRDSHPSVLSNRWLAIERHENCGYSS